MGGGPAYPVIVALSRQDEVDLATDGLVAQLGDRDVHGDIACRECAGLPGVVEFPGVVDTGVGLESLVVDFYLDISPIYQDVPLVRVPPISI